MYEVIYFYTGQDGKFFTLLADYLRDSYINTRYIPDGKEWPPNQPKYYVNLAVIHYQGSQTPEEVIFSVHHSEHTNLATDDELLLSTITDNQSKISNKSKITREIVDLFRKDLDINDSSKEGDASTSTNLSKSILIEGAPGIGKTILLKEVAYRWANGTILDNAIIVFLIYLRDSRFQLVSTINKLIQYFDCLDESEIPMVVRQLKKSNGEGVVFLLDGLDEYPDALQNDFLSRLIDRKILSKCVFVITSRPCASLTLHNKVERRIEILGFGNEEQDEYISKSLKSLPEKKEKLEMYLKQHTMLNSLVYIPFHLSVLLFLFQQGNLPETLTEMNESFIVHTVYRHMEKHVTTCIVKLGDLPEDVHNVIYKLSRLAFQGLQKNQLIFTFDEIKQVCPEVDLTPRALNGFGLLQAVQHYPVKGAGVTVSFNFLHLTMQEFLAAWYVSRCSIKEQKQLLKQSFMNTKSWDELSSSNARMWQMYVGIVGVNCDAWIQFTNESNLTLSACENPLNYLYYLQCLVEGKCDHLDLVSSPFENGTIDFRFKALIPYHMVLLCLFLSKSSECWNYFYFRHNAIGDVGIKILTNFLLLNTKILLHITTLDLSDNYLTSQSASAIYDVILGGALNTLSLSWNILDDRSMSMISQALQSNVTVKTLDLSCNHIGVDGAKSLAVALCHNCTLEHLFINRNKIMDDGAVAICECFKINNKRLSFIKSLRLASNSLTSCSITAITTAIQEGALTLLDLSSNDLGDNDVYEISKALQVNLTIKQLYLVGSNIVVSGALSLAVALCYNHTLENLYLADNKILDDGAIAFGESLKTNRTLKYLDITHNNITEIGATEIAEVFKCNPVLEGLRISGKECVKVFKPDHENLLYNETVGRCYCFNLSKLSDPAFGILLYREWII